MGCRRLGAKVNRRVAKRLPAVSPVLAQEALLPRVVHLDDVALLVFDHEGEVVGRGAAGGVVDGVVLVAEAAGHGLGLAGQPDVPALVVSLGHSVGTVRRHGPRATHARRSMNLLALRTAGRW